MNKIEELNFAEIEQVDGALSLQNVAVIAQQMTSNITESIVSPATGIPKLIHNINYLINFYS
ncbi:hypothetical protein EUU23_01995 [Sphingorhabdus sp. IMCC26285]|uniref:Bacteriocin n=1 Tax=Sphingorhabdus profundilacus TaxID=2509718 RepID=A0A6I4LXC4_9SPHN|nr:hypothetical protein [Sphingorhabdus profundilacus]MVZ96474.1 hypothetical protein [Sphingorhabdus profundilacus]